MSLFGDLPPVLIADGAMLIPNFLSVDAQISLAAQCHIWGEPPGGWHHPKVRGGYMSVETVCLGWHWFPYGYAKTTVGNGDHPVQPMDTNLIDLGREAVRRAVGEAAAVTYGPDVALINRYGPTAKMGMHQDRDERVNAPVVSFSIGASAVFRFGNTVTRNRPYVDIMLNSGDAFVFWGQSRFAFHGITKIITGSAPIARGLGNERLNITLRESGLSAA